MDRGIDRILDFSERHKRALSIVAGLWMAISWASYARFIELPEIPFLTGMPAIIAASIFNALWWGFLNPRIERRRKTRAVLTTSGAEHG